MEVKEKDWMTKYGIQAIKMKVVRNQEKVKRFSPLKALLKASPTRLPQIQIFIYT